MNSTGQKTAYEIDKIANEGQLREALSLALQVIKDGSVDEDIYFVAAKIAFQLNELPKAEQLVNRLLALDPDHINGWVLISEIQKAQADMIRYQHSLKMAEELFPASKEFGVLNSSFVKSSVTEPHDSVPNDNNAQPYDSGGKGPSLDDSSFETITFAEICINQGYFNKALKILTDLLAKDPGNPDLKRRVEELERKMNRKPGT